MKMSDTNLYNAHSKAINEFGISEYAINFGWSNSSPESIMSKVYGLGFISTWYDYDDKKYYSEVLANKATTKSR